jgi:hypothetical protein
MDYYKDKYPIFCVEAKPLDEEVDQAIDLIVKNNKIYKVKNRTFKIWDEEELSEYIDELVIDCDFIHELSQNGQTVLTRKNSLSYVIINVKTDDNNERYWNVELVEPEFVSYV